MVPPEPHGACQLNEPEHGETVPTISLRPVSCGGPPFLYLEDPNNCSCDVMYSLVVERNLILVEKGSSRCDGVFLGGDKYRRGVHRRRVSGGRAASEG
eukprot:2574084-Pyramimonas_sp.AAC.1